MAITRNQQRTPVTLSLKDILIAKKIVYVSLVIITLAVVYKYFLIILIFGNPFDNIIAIRLDYVSGKLDYSWSNSIAFFMSSLLMLNIGFLLGIGFEVKKRVFIFAILMLVANDVTIGGANWTFSSLVLLFCVWAATKERLGQFKMSVKTFGKIAFVLGISTTIILTLLYFRSEGGIGGDASFFDTILYYAGGDIATFGYFINNPYPSVPPGRHTLGGLYKLIDSIFSIFGADFLGPQDNELFVADIGQRSNTSIHFSHYYSDFGFGGIVVFIFLLGLLSMLAMKFYQRRFNLLRTQYFGLILFVCIISIRSVPTEGKYFWILLIFLPFLYKVVDIFEKIKLSSGVVKKAERLNLPIFTVNGSTQVKVTAPQPRIDPI